MKTQSTIRKFFLVGSIAALLATPAAQAATIYWDVNGTGTGFSTVVGAWDGTNAFWNDQITGTGGTPTATVGSTDDLNIVAATTNTGTITLSGARAASSITFASGVGAVTMSGAGSSLALGGTGASQGIFNNSASNQVISTAITLASAATINNSGAGTLSIGGATASTFNLNSFALIVSGTGVTTFDGNVGNIISGAGGITKNGTGSLILDGGQSITHTFTGGITINGGSIRVQNGTNLSGRGNVTINSGYLGARFGTTASFAGGLGTGTTAIQILGGTSGFSGEGGTGSTFTVGTALSVLKWGATGENGATGFFNPTVLLLGGDQGMNTNSKGTLANGIDLNGTNRTITSLHSNGDGVSTTGFTVSGVISNSTGTAGFEKTGPGNVILGNANTYNGTTTITGGSLTASASGSLGSGVATNTLIFNGGTLLASGAITSPSARGVTMTGTGIINSNTFAVSIAGDIGGLGGLTKNSTGTLTLSGTNTYGGVTTVNAGTLAITKEASLASNTAANLNVKSGATLALNVDSNGSAGFGVTNLNTLLTNISVANAASQGLQAGAILGFDTSTANLGTFTQGNVIANSTGAFGGSIGLAKFGAGTLVLNQANTYTGPTTITTGTLQLGSGTGDGSLNASGSIGVGTGAIFAVNQTDTVTQGTDFGFLSGLGGFTQAGSGTTVLNQPNIFSGTTTVIAGTLSLANALALQNSALVTTSGTTTLGTFSAVTIGGLSGATGDLGSADVLSGYTGLVTALTLNPQTGVSVTYGGIISNGSGNMSLTKTGAGTQILTGANSYTGATIVNAGTLTVGVGGSLDSSSALQINGGTFTYGNTAAGQTVNGLAVGSGNSTVSNTAAAQTLTVGAINRTASIFGTVNFATLTGPISTTTGNANSIIGPWATTGSTTTLRYAVGSPDGSTPTNISPFTTGTTATANTLGNVTDATVNYEYSAAVAAMGAGLSLTGNTLRYSGGATGTAINATTTLTLNGLMQAGTGLLTISGGPTTGGILIGSTGELVITANAQATTISAAIGGTGRLVYSGAGSTLSLSSLTNAYTGGTVINSGTVNITGTANTNVDSVLGNSSGGITLNGGRLQASGTNIVGARIVTVNGTGSSTLVNKNNNFTTTGKLTGDGTLTTVDAGGNGTNSTYSFNSTSNDYTGRLIGSNTIINVNSLGDSTNSIVLNDGAAFNYGTGATGATSLPNRVIEFAGTTGATINNNNTTAANTLSIGGGLLVTGLGNKTLTLGGANTGANTFGGNISDGPGSVISLTKTAAGTWVLGGSNTYTGQTTIDGGVLRLANTAAVQNTSAVRLNTAGGTLALGTDIAFSTDRLLILGANSTVQSDRATAGAGLTHVFTTVATVANATHTFSAGTNVTSGTAGIQLAGINLTSGSGGTATLSPTTANLTITGNVTGANTGTNTLTLAGTSTGNSISGAILKGTRDTQNLFKDSTSTWVLTGTGSDYNGTTTVTSGTLAGIGANAFGNTTGISIAGSGILSLRGDSSTNFQRASDSVLYPVTTTANGATINVNQATIAGTGAKTMTIGTLALNNAVTNGTTFTGANNTSLSIGAVTTAAAAAGTETLTNNISGGGSLTLASLAVTRTGTPTVAFNGTGITTVTGAITQVATTALTKSGTGTVALEGTNTYTGLTTVTDGVLRLNSANALPGGIATSGGTGALTLNNGILGLGHGDFTRGLGTGVTQVKIDGGGFAAFGADRTVNIGGAGAAVTFNGGNFPTSIFTLSHSTADATLIFANEIGLGVGGRSITVNNGSAPVDARITGALTGSNGFTKNGTGSLQLTGTNTYTGTLTISAGTLELGNNTTTGSFTGLNATITNNAELSINRSDAFSEATGLNNRAIGGTGAFTQAGSGTTTLSLDNTYTGATTVNAGSLLVNGSISGSSAVTVNGGTLGGTGSISGAVAVSGTLAPGASIETLASGALSMNNGSTFAVELNSSVATSSGADLMKVTGNLSLTGTVTLSLDDIATTDVAFTQGTTFSLLNYTGTWNSGFFTVSGNELSDGESFTAGLNEWQISYGAAEGGLNFAGEYAGGADSFVTITAVPEPGAVMSLLAGMGVLAFVRRRRR